MRSKDLLVSLILIFNNGDAACSQPIVLRHGFHVYFPVCSRAVGQTPKPVQNRPLSGPAWSRASCASRHSNGRTLFQAEHFRNALADVYSVLGYSRSA